MSKPFEKWTVLPHGRMTRIDDNLATVTGVMQMPPMGDVTRCMTIARLADGRLVIYSAIALDEAEMKALEAFGTPTYLVVPSDIHRMDVKIWKDRYPEITVIAPAGSRAKVEAIVAVDHTQIDFGDPSVQLVTVPGTGDREAALVVETSGRTTLVLNDLIFNLPNRSGLSGWLFKKIGMTGDAPHIPPIIKLRAVKDASALKAQLERWSQLPTLKRVVVSHGTMIGSNAAQVLHQIAEGLAA